MRKRVSLLFFACAVLTAVLLHYANQTYFPYKLRLWTTKRLEIALNRPVDIESVRFNLIKGFQVRNLKIFRKDSPEDILTRIDSMSFNILYFTFLRSQKIVIPSLSLNGISVHLIRNKNGYLNIQDLLPSGSKHQKHRLGILIGKLSLGKAKIHFTDLSLNKPLEEEISNIGLSGNISLAGNFRFKFEAGNKDSPAAYLSANGYFNLNHKKISAQVQLNRIDLAKYSSLYMPPQSFALDSGMLEVSNMVISYENGKIEVNSRTKTKELKFRLDSGQSFSGNPSLGLNFTYDTLAKKILNVEGYVDPYKSNILGIPRIVQVSNIEGRVYFKEDSLTTDSLRGETLNTRIFLTGNLTNFKNPFLDVELFANAELKDWKILFRDFLGEYTADIAGPASLRLAYRGEVKKGKNAQINIQTQLKDVTIKTDKLPVPISDCRGELRFTNDILSWNDLSFSLYGIPIRSKATIQRLSETPSINFHAQASADLNKLSAVFPDIFQKNDIALSGAADMAFDYIGSFPSTKQTKLALTVEPHNAILTSAKLPYKLSEISGLFIYTNNEFSWSNLKARFLNELYTSNGVVKNFSKPTLSASVDSPILNFFTRIDILRDYFNITELKGRYLDSTFDVQGEVSYPQKVPQLDLAGNITLDLKNLDTLFSSQKETFKKIKPQGKCQLSGSFIGPVDNWHQWQIALSGTGKDIVLSDYHLTDVNATLNPLTSGIHQLSLFSDLYDGSLSVKLSTDLSTKDLLSSFVIAAKNVDLSRMRKDTIWKNQNVSGTFSGTFNGQGKLGDSASLKGQGSVLIADGHLWQLNLLQNFGQFLLIPEYGDIVFREAKGTFTIENSRLYTDDFNLKSKPLDLICRGWIDFKGNLNLYLFSLFSKQIIEESTSLKKTITSILTHTDDYLTIRLTGTLKKPKYVILPSSVDVLKKTKDFILESLQGILE